MLMKTNEFPVKTKVKVGPAIRKRFAVSGNQISHAPPGRRAMLGALIRKGEVTLRPNMAMACKAAQTYPAAIRAALRKLESGRTESPVEYGYRLTTTMVEREAFFDAHPDECLAAVDRATKPTSTKTT
jgi:hypothetical protein